MEETKRNDAVRATHAHGEENPLEGASHSLDMCDANGVRAAHETNGAHGARAARESHEVRDAHAAKDARDPHEAHDHARAELHHHHTHAAHSKHAGGHHLLQVENLDVSFRMYDPDDRRFFRAKKRDVRVIADLNVSVHVGEVVAVVGASGSGKTLLADSVLGLFEPNATVSGTVWFDGMRCSAADLARLRGNGISLVPQSSAHLDPLMKVGAQVRGVAKDAADAKRRAAAQRELFARYGLAPEVADMYPFELSGGMARRVLLCCALIDEPKLIVADEPTPGLDLDLAVRALDDLRAFADSGGGVLLITHDIELALRVADRVAVFKDGTVVEETAVADFASPDLLRHPFTKALWHALPEHGFSVADEHAEGVQACSGGALEENPAQGDSSQEACVRKCREEDAWENAPSAAHTHACDGADDDADRAAKGGLPC